MAERPSADGPLLELDQVSRVYRTRTRFFGGRGRAVVALDRVSLTFDRGEIFGLVGESGSGKTTCARLIVGLESPDEGRIVLEDQDLTALRGRAYRQYRRQVQMVFQDPYQSLNPQLTILDSMAEPLITNRIDTHRQRRARVMDSLKTVGLSPPEDFIYRFPHQLSGGQRQRVAIARAMIVDPACVVADEPTSMLDASYSAQIFELLRALRREFSATVIFITHSLAAARYLCDRIAVIYRGRLMEQGPATEVIERPRHPYTRALLDATPKFGRGEKTPRYDTLIQTERVSAGAGVGCAFYPRCKPARPERCDREIPVWRQVGPDHVAACHFAAGGPEAGG
ncbi:MAG: ATP-binding cassette domain-containing protein [Proteobacteria bacterium]|nr:ATP-binding cassette domain-containing protein [Pseudomonadota bacterium]MBU1740642.1 ATP-binding cassette domain-containing protein [Pseudomonadota bacterium]